jgi:HEAT repeat protein
MRGAWLAAVLLSTATAAPARAGDLFGGGLETLATDLRGPEAARRREAVDKLDAYGADEARPYLLKALEDPDLEVRVRAALSIGRHHLTEATPRLVALVEDPEPRLRAAAVEAIGLVRGAGSEPDARSLGALERALGDSDPAVRQAALVAIGRLDRDRAQAVTVALAARLDDDNAGVRQRACDVLGRLGDARAVIPLLARLGDGSRDVRAAALDALGQLGDERAAPAMIRLLADPAEEVRAQAVQALGRVRARAAVGPLAELVEHGADPMRGRAAFALGQIGGESVVAPLVAALGRDEVRSAAREALGRVGGPSVAPLIARLPAASGEELGAIVDVLGELHDLRAAPALLDELDRGHAARERIVDALGAILHARPSDAGRRDADERAVESRAIAELTGLLDDKEPAVRRRAMAALAGVVDLRAAGALEQAVSDGDREVRLAAVRELGRLKAASALGPLTRASASSDEPTAAAAARALGELEDPRAAPPLVAALSRGEPRVRREAADALGRLHDAASIQPIMRLARTAPAERRPDAVAALGFFLRGRSDATARELLLGLAEANDPATSAAALEAVDALAASRDPQAVPRLERLLGRAADDVALRRRLVQALAELEPDAALLTARLDGDSDPRVRAEAAWALGKRRADAGSIAALTRALASSSAAVRANAAAALARLGQAPPQVTRLLDDADPAARANAALAVAKLPGWRATLDRLRARDPDRHVRAAAARALAGSALAPRVDWIALHLTDFDGAPLADARFRLVLPDGLVKSGAADARGVAREESLPRGACELELPDDPPSR